ncbi:MAG: PEGA domain-containing protein [Archangium sp.]|nr:PEGA domain-containing protein [Archangium sp.]
MTDPKEQDDIREGPAALGADGRLEQRLERVEQAGVPAPSPAPEANLHLAARAPKAIEQRVENYRAELRARNARPWALKLVIGALVAGLGGLGALLYFKPKLDLQSLDGVREANLLDELTAGGEREPIIISSTPTGATIIIGGKTVGETPWAGENVWRGETTLVLKLAGYQPWQGKLRGGKPATLDIRLKK